LNSGTSKDNENSVVFDSVDLLWMSFIVDLRNSYEFRNYEVLRVFIFPSNGDITVYSVIF
jgi:hypothetical protein